MSVSFDGEFTLRVERVLRVASSLATGRRRENRVHGSPRRFRIRESLAAMQAAVTIARQALGEPRGAALIPRDVGSAVPRLDSAPRGSISDGLRSL